MQFLFPSYLWALLAVSIPIIIHLFNFRRTKKVFFTNVAFLKTVETQTSSFRKLKQWLILAARTLFIASLVMAFAQPFLPAKNSIGQKSSGLGVNSLYIDNSLSMQNTTDNKRFLDLAVIKIDELLSLFRNSPNIQLVSNDFSGNDQQINNASKIKDQLTTLSFSANPRTLESVYKRQRNLAQKHNPSGQNQFFWFSDFQKSTVGDLKKLKIDTLDKVFIVPIKGKSNQNVFVDSVWLASPFIREMQNNVLFVKVFNSGDHAIEKLPIKLFLDDAQASTASVDIAANGSATAKFNFTVKNKGFHKGKVSFDDQPITFDNEYFFVLNASPSVQILHLFQNKSKSDYIAKVFANDSLFNFKAYNALNVDVGQFKNADLIILEGVEQVSGSFNTGLQEFVRKGGSLVVIPAAQSNLESYKAFLRGFGIQNLSMQNVAPLAQSQIPISEPDKQSQFFADVFEKTAMQGVANVPNMQALWSWSSIGEKILTFRTGQTVLSQTPYLKGKVYVCASSLDNTYGNFAEHAFFVPTMFKIASLSLRSERAAYNFNEGTISLEMPNIKKNASYKLKKGKFEIIPIQKSIDNTLMLELPKGSQLTDNQILESGYYELQIDGKTEKILALNHDNQESKMDFYTSDELSQLLGNQKNISVMSDLNDGDFMKTFQENNIGKSLWKYFIIAALAFLLIEILLIRFLKG